MLSQHIHFMACGWNIHLHKVPTGYGDGSLFKRSVQNMKICILKMNAGNTQDKVSSMSIMCLHVWTRQKKSYFYCVLHRYTLRIKFFPEDLKDFYQRDKASFFFLYDQVILMGCSRKNLPFHEENDNTPPLLASHTGSTSPLSEHPHLNYPFLLTHS